MTALLTYLEAIFASIGALSLLGSLAFVVACARRPLPPGARTARATRPQPVTDAPEWARRPIPIPPYLVDVCPSCRATMEVPIRGGRLTLVRVRCSCGRVWELRSVGVGAVDRDSLFEKQVREIVERGG